MSDFLLPGEEPKASAAPSSADLAAADQPQQSSFLLPGEQALSSSLQQAVPVNPDDAAKAGQISRATGIPLEVVNRNRDAVDAQARVQQIQSTLQTSPVLAKQMTDPNFASVAHDDVHNLSSIEQVAKGDNSPSGIGGAAWRGVKEGYYDAAGFSSLVLAPLAMAADYVVPGEHTASDWYFKKTADPNYNALASLKEQDAGNTFPQKLAGSVGTMAVNLAEIAATGGAGEAPQATSALRILTNASEHAIKSMWMPATVNAANTGKQVYEATGDGNAALRAAGGQYAATTGMGLVPLSTPGGVLARLGTGFISGTVSGEASRRLTNATMPDNTQTPFSWEDVFLNGATGSLLGAAMGPRASQSGMAAAIHKSAESVEAAGQTTQDHANISSMMGIAAADPLRERSPQDFAAFAQSVADEGPHPAVFIDARILAQEVQAKGFDLGRHMPETAAQMKDAIAIGGDVRIPLGELTTALPGTGLENSLMEHMRTSIDGPTLREVKDKTLETETQKQVEQIMAQHEFNAALTESGMSVENELVTQLNEANRFTPDVNKVYAKLAAATFKTRAAQLGITPEEMYVRYPLEIESALGKAMANSMDHAQPLPAVHEAPAARLQSIKADALAPFIGVHYSRTPGLTEVSGDRYGSGMRGAEAKRLDSATDPRIKRRAYFYPQGDSLPMPESGVGAHAHVAELHNLYDFAKDPANIIGKMKGISDSRERANAMESAVLDAGYNGYRAGNMAVVLDNNVPVKYIGSLSDLQRAQDEQRTSTEGQAASVSGTASGTGIRPGGGSGDAGLAEAQRAAETAAHGADKLTDLPDKPLYLGGKWYVPGPFAAAHKAAADYMARTGLPYEPPKTYTPVDPERAASIARAFEEMVHAPNDPEVKAAYDAMIAETLAQWETIKATGLKVEFIKPEQADPYAESPRQAIDDVIQNNHLWVFPTDSGFGGSESAHIDVSGNPLLALTTEVIDGHQLRANDIFRIVHDYFGHIKDGNGFRASGEENAWRSHAAMYSPLARRAMTTETRGQNSWVNFGPHGEKNQAASAAETQYAPQKIGLLPEWASEEGRLDPLQNGKASYNQGIGDEYGQSVRAAGEPEELYRTVGGGGAKPGWTEATRIRRDNGEPATLYRGAARPLGATDFGHEALGVASGHPSSGLGVFFSVSKAEAATYGDVGGYHLDLRNPFTIKAENLPGFDTVADAAMWREKVRKAGHDGIIISAKHLGGKVHAVAFEPEQVIHPKNELEQPAYHGSPHDFDKFSTDHIGSGEGVQAYGWGLYFAENPNIAKSYHKSLAGGPTIAEWKFGSVRPVKGGEYQDYSPRDSSDQQQARALLTEDLLISERIITAAFEDGGVEAARKEMLNVVDERIASAKEEQPSIVSHLKVLRNRIENDLTFTMTPPEGGVYQVDIPDEHVARMLDWDAPLSDQSPEVREALKSFGIGSDKSPDEMDADELLGALGHFEQTLNDKEKTGAGLYKELEQHFGSDKAASEALNAAGIPGIKYDDAGSRGSEGGTHNLVVFDHDIIKLTHKDGKPLTQQERDAYFQSQQPKPEASRGKITFGDDITKQPSVIHLLENADLSTFVHELGHFNLEVLNHMASMPDAPLEVRADMNALLKWFGVENLDTWNAMSLEEKRPHHEQLARGFEAYLFEGKAPSTELQSVFSRVRAWMVNAYKSLASLNVTLTPEVRGVFDRMLATNEQILDAEAQRGEKPLFESAEEVGAAPEEWQAYLEQQQEQTQEAVDQLQSRSLRDMQWLSNAKSRILRGLQRDAKAKRAMVEAEVTNEVNAQPTYQAQHFLKTGEMRAENGDLVKVDKGAKLDASALKEMYPDTMLGRPDLSKLKGMTRDGGLHPDLVADMFGHTSGDQLVRNLIDAHPKKEVIEGMTDQRMLERYGDLTSADAMDRAVNEALANEAHLKMLATELRFAEKAAGSRATLVKAAKEFAAQIIARKKVGDINPRQFEVAENKARKAAQEAHLKGDRIAVAKAKREQLVNAHATKMAYAALDEIRKGSDYQKKFDKDSIRNKIDVDIREQIDALRERFDFRKTPPTGPTRAEQNLKEWMDGQIAAGYAPMTTPDMLDPTVRVHYEDMSLEQFRGFIDTVKSLEHIGRERRNITLDGQRTDLNEYVKTKLVPKLQERGERFTKDQLLDKPEDRHTNPIAIALDHLNAWRRSAAAQLKPQEFKRNEYDRHELLGPFGEAIFDPVINANYRRVAMLKGLSNDFAAEAEKLGRDWQNSLREGVTNDTLLDPDKSEEGKPVHLNMTRGKMLGVALHVGNESNFNKLARGWGWEPGDVWKFLHQNMSEKDWQATQAVWDLYEKHWPDMEAMNRRLGNTSPDKIEPRPFRTQFGEMRGGYAAISYDSIRSRRGEKAAAGESINPGEGLFNRNYFRADTTTNGSLNKRVDSYTDRVDLDYHGIARHLNETIHDLAYREALIDANKIIEHPEFRREFKKAYGPEAYSSMRDWLGQLANSNNTDRSVGALGKFLQYTRTGMVINAIAFRASTVLKHGGSAGIKTLGYFAGGGEKYLLSRMASMGTDYTNQIKGAQEKFGEIRNRLLQQDRDFRATSASMFEPKSKRAWAERGGHAMVAWSDMMTAVPTAWAAYDRAITEGIPESQGGTGEPMTEKQAIAYANKIVREAHGSTAEAARSMVLNTQSEAMKMFTTLYGFMNNSYGQQLDAYDKLRTNGIGNAPVLARTFMAIIVPALWAGYLSHRKTDEDSWAGWMGKAITGEVAASVPFVRDAYSMVEGHSNAGLVAAESWLASIVQAGKDMARAAGGDPGKTKPIKDVANAVGTGLHIPGLGQLGGTLQYAADVRAGKENPQSTREYLEGLVMGRAPKP